MSKSPVGASTDGNARMVVPYDLDPMDFYEEYYEWIMDTSDGGWKDLYIQRFEDGWNFEAFIESRHPERMVPA